MEQKHIPITGDHNSSSEQSTSSVVQENSTQKASAKSQSIFKAAFNKRNYENHLASSAVRLSYINSILGAGTAYYIVGKISSRPGAAALSAYTTAIFAWSCTYLMARRGTRATKVDVANAGNSISIEKTLTDDYTLWDDD